MIMRNMPASKINKDIQNEGSISGKHVLNLKGNFPEFNKDRKGHVDSNAELFNHIGTEIPESKIDGRAYVDPIEKLDELWIHTGTKCNLKCSGCYEGSNPTNDRILQPDLNDIRPYLKEAKHLNVKKINFTGGEPFVNPDFMEILFYTIQDFDVLVLSNGTKPIQKNLEKLIALTDFNDHKLDIRISLDNVDKYENDEIRGKGSFDLAFGTIYYLNHSPIGISVAGRKPYEKEKQAETINNYTKFFDEIESLEKIKNQVKIQFFAELNPKQKVPKITSDCIKKYKTQEDLGALMCHNTRMIAKEGDGFQIYPCPITDSSQRMRMGKSLTESLKMNTYLEHKRCYTMCFKENQKCGI